jgi:hypothetical protein
VLAHDCHGSFPGCFTCELVPIEISTRHSKEHIARLHLTRVRARAARERFRRTAQQFAGARFCYEP